MITDGVNTKGAELELRKFTNLSAKKKVSASRTAATPTSK
jgi:hypothetical protein